MCMNEGTPLSDTWLPGPREQEWLNLSCSAGGDLAQTHPELVRQVSKSFPPLPPERFPFRIRRDYMFRIHCEAPSPYYPPLPHMRDSYLISFLRPQHAQNGPNRRPLTIAEARNLIREVHYDRGPIVYPIDRKAKEMASCAKRLDSFNKSADLRGKAIASQLAQCGFFFVSGDHNAVGKLRCSFCRRTFSIFTTDDAAHVATDWDRWLIALLHRHAHRSATCPFSFGLNADDIRLEADAMSRIAQPPIRVGSSQQCSPNLATTPNLETSSIRDAAMELSSTFPSGLPPLDGADAEKYSEYLEYLAQYDYESFSEFESESKSESESESESETDPNSFSISVSGERHTFTPRRTPIDDYIGDEPPKHPHWSALIDRLDSFAGHPWSQRPLSEAVTPESLARAGFFYAGDADRVQCHYCGEQLNAWQPLDNPWVRHVCTRPTCPWLSRCLGRPRVWSIYLREQQRRRQTQPLASDIFSEDTDERILATRRFLREIEYISGMEILVQ